MTFDKLNKIIENYLINNKNKVKINSNDVLKGDVFFALQGTKNHGNDYVEQAINKGAKFVVTDKKLNLIIKEKQILLVKDILFFLLTIANKKRNIFKGKVIGITGSVGKTSVKENLKFFLSSEFNVSASIKSYNNYLGVLISLVNMNLNSDFAIFEIGTNNFYEISHLASIIMPQQVIITNIFPTHLENFKNTRNIAKEKSDIFNPKFNPNVELLILPISNNDELYLYEQAKKINISKILTLGENESSDYCILNVNEKAKNLSIIRVKHNGKLFEILVNTNIYHLIYNTIICLMIFNYNSLSFNKFSKLTKYVPKIEGRGLEKKIIFSNKEVHFIDESYNASPITMKICIDYFDKLELQENQNKFHCPRQPVS